MGRAAYAFLNGFKGGLKPQAADYLAVALRRQNGRPTANVSVRSQKVHLGFRLVLRVVSNGEWLLAVSLFRIHLLSRNLRSESSESSTQRGYLDSYTEPTIVAQDQSKLMRSVRCELGAAAPRWVLKWRLISQTSFKRK